MFETNKRLHTVRVSIQLYTYFTELVCLFKVITKTPYFSSKRIFIHPLYLVCMPFYPVSLHSLIIFLSSFIPKEIPARRCKSDQRARKGECECPLYRVLAGAPIARPKLIALWTQNLVAEAVLGLGSNADLLIPPQKHAAAQGYVETTQNTHRNHNKFAQKYQKC